MVLLIRTDHLPLNNINRMDLNERGFCQIGFEIYILQSTTPAFQWVKIKWISITN